MKWLRLDKLYSVQVKILRHYSIENWLLSQNLYKTQEGYGVSEQQIMIIVHFFKSRN